MWEGLEGVVIKSDHITGGGGGMQAGPLSVPSNTYYAQVTPGESLSGWLWGLWSSASLSWSGPSLNCLLTEQEENVDLLTKWPAQVIRGSIKIIRIIPPLWTGLGTWRADQSYRGAGPALVSLWRITEDLNSIKTNYNCALISSPHFSGLQALRSGLQYIAFLSAKLSFRLLCFKYWF